MEELVAEYLRSLAAVKGRLVWLRREEKHLRGAAYLQNRREQAALRGEVLDMEYALRLMARYLPLGKGGR